MIVVFSCPQCRKVLRADDDYAGKKIQCRTCKAVLYVPGAPPVRQVADGEDGQKAQPDEIPEPRDGVSPDHVSKGLPAANALGEQADSSYGLASLYLAAFSFVLFFTPALLSGMLGAIGASIAFFAGLFVNTGCFLFCWHGYRLARRAEELPGNQGYAEAGKIVNKFFMKFYALGFVFFLIGGIVALYIAKHYVNQTQGALQGIQKALGP